jgi:hypothetical protein
LLASPAIAASSNDLIPSTLITSRRPRRTDRDRTHCDDAPLDVDAFIVKAFAKRGWKPGDSVNYGNY